jgi:hypothetical protein
LLSRRGCSLPANASGVAPHRASITSRFGQVSILMRYSIYAAPVPFAACTTDIIETMITID